MFASVNDALNELFETTWGRSLTELVGREPADLEGALAPQEEAARSLLSTAGARVAELTAQLERWLWSRNQFLTLEAVDRELLTTSLERALRSMQTTQEARPALRHHRKELAAWLRSKLGEEPREVTCAEYSPSLQLAVLGLKEALRPPILDVGCGPHAALVRHLREEGLDAHGLDRVLDAELGQAGDWLTFDYGQERWGTILSHQGFSLHFLHHHHAAGDQAYAYARAFMAMLRALHVGGTLAYAPGLPFIEQMLPPHVYRVERVPFATELRVPALREVEARTGLSFSYATHVTRL
jgi:hypothetical protein